MSRQINYQNDQFSDPHPHQYPQHHNNHHQRLPNVPGHSNQAVVNFDRNFQQHPYQYRDSRLYGMQSLQSHAYQGNQMQSFSFQPTQHNFQQNQAPSSYSALAANPTPVQEYSQRYSKLAEPQPQYSQLVQPQHYAANQTHVQLPPPPQYLAAPFIQREHQPPQLEPTDPRNTQSNPTSNPLSNGNINVVATQQQMIDTTNSTKKKNLSKKEKVLRPHVNPEVDCTLMDFLSLAKVAAYKKIGKKMKTQAPLIDEYHGVPNLESHLIATATICIAYHCSGNCSPECKKNTTHRPLSTSERTRLLEYLSEAKSRIMMKNKGLQEKKMTKDLLGNMVNENDRDERFDYNPFTVSSRLGEIVKSPGFDVFKYRKCAKMFGYSAPRLDAYHEKDDSPLQGEICLVYHCKGKCSRQCSDKESHRRLTGTEDRRLYGYISQVHILMKQEGGSRGDSDDDEEERSLQEQVSNDGSETRARDDGEESTKSGKRKAGDSSGSGSNQSNKKQRLDLANNDGRFDDCPDDDEVEILGTIAAPVVSTPSRSGSGGTAAHPVDLTDTLTPMTKELYSEIPTRKSQVVSSSSSLDLEQTSDTTTAASVPTTEDTATASTTLPDDSTQPGSPRSIRNEDQPDGIPKLLLPVSSNGINSVKEPYEDATMTPADSDAVNQEKPPEQPRKEVLSPNSKLRKLKRLKAQLELAKKQHELAKLQHGLRKKDQELKMSQDSSGRKTLPPITALSTSLIIENINESGPEHMVFFPNSEFGHDLRLAEYKAILYGTEEEVEAKETLSDRKTQIEQDLAILKQRLESSLPTVAAASMSKEDLQRKLEEAQANKDLSYWKLFVSKQEHILSNVDKQIQENAASLYQCAEEMAKVEQASRETLKSIKVLKVRESTLEDMAAKSSMKILQMRQRLHEQQAQAQG